MITSRILVWNLPAEARNVSTSDGRVRTPNFAPTVRLDLGKRSSAQRWAATNSHGGCSVMQARYTALPARVLGVTGRPV